MSELSPEHALKRIREALPEARVELIPNPSPCGQHALLLQKEDAVAVATFLRDDAELRLDYASNVSGVDAIDRGCLEVVYHLYSVSLKHGPIVLKLRTDDRGAGVVLPSLTPVYRSAELQEREIYDLCGVRFEGHPDLRRLLMWEEFEAHPMRKDYSAE